MSANDSNYIIYGNLELGDAEYKLYKDVEIGIATAEFRKVKDAGWSCDTSTKKLSITENISDFTSENSEWYV